MDGSNAIPRLGAKEFEKSISIEFRLIENGAQRPRGEIAIPMHRDDDESLFLGMAEIMMTAADMRDRVAAARERREDALSANWWQARHGMVTAIFSKCEEG
jgi:hypothetical protein